MALVTSLPATTPFFSLDISYPLMPVGATAGTQPGDPRYTFMAPYAEIVAASQLQWTAGSFAGGVFTDVFRTVRGVACRGFSAGAGGVIAQAQSGFVQWQTEDPLNFGPGYESSELARVIIWDYRFQTDTAAGAPLNGETGVLWQPYNGLALPGDSWPSGLNPLGGFGIVGTAVAGAQAWLYLSTEVVTGNVLETIAIPPAAIPDVQEWSLARFVFVASGPGREALLSLTVNGTSIFADKPFGTAQLPRLATSNPLAYSYAPNIRMGNITGEQLNWTLRIRAGKFLLDGTEVRF